MIAGRTVFDQSSMRVFVDADGPAAVAHIKDGDRVLAVNQHPIANWEDLKKAVSAHPGEAIDMTMERDGKEWHAQVTPGAVGTKLEGRIQIGAYYHNEPVTVGEAAKLSVLQPPRIVYELVRGIGRMITLKDKPELSGPVGITKEMAKAVKSGPGPAFEFLGVLSAYLGGFNLLPVPALDGGRLIFLFFEAISRRKADAKVEAGVHLLGLFMMITLLMFVTYFDIMPKH
jgi:regulator of sigma E protease